MGRLHAEIAASAAAFNEWIAIEVHAANVTFNEKLALEALDIHTHFDRKLVVEVAATKDVAIEMHSTVIERLNYEHELNLVAKPKRHRNMLIEERK